ncbi:hypothetical protein CEXT_426141 [Caerostris extrusa]|uniref:Uncharacterized protein n=1 Tax=Caerostris extrusa TaxID=172846 RepID=A0AAV4R7T3_CAEEX|nr:hypothetical protein CEXT_426141 [Caerostris extrusa]
MRTRFLSFQIQVEAIGIIYFTVSDPLRPCLNSHDRNFISTNIQAVIQFSHFQLSYTKRSTTMKRQRPSRAQGKGGTAKVLEGSMLKFVKPST